MNHFERKFGKYAVRNLSLVLIACYILGYIIELFAPSIQSLLTLNPHAILQGQIWRLVTWVLIPPSSLDFFTIIMLLFYYSVGTSLERIWGTYRYNVYLFSGMITDPEQGEREHSVSASAEENAPSRIINIIRKIAFRTKGHRPFLIRLNNADYNITGNLLASLAEICEIS